MTCRNIGVHVVVEPRREEGTEAAVDGAGRVMGADRAAAARRPEAG
jgi:hypothetical protein